MKLYNDVVARLSMLGYKVEAAEGEQDAAVLYSIERAAEHIRRETNRSVVPDGLYYVHVDMAAGLFLQDKKNAGQLGEAFDLSVPVKSISEGDVSVTYAGASDGCSTAEMRFDVLIDSLTGHHQGVFAAFRRMKW